MPMLPRLLFTMGDPAGIGPEIIVQAWRDPRLHDHARPVVVGDAAALRRAAPLYGYVGEIVTLTDIHEADVFTRPERLLCMPTSDADLGNLPIGIPSAVGGKAAYDYLCRAIELTTAGQADGIVTAPLHKAALRLAGVAHPGHTEILAERTGTASFGMMLYGDGVGVTHVTLHVGLRDVFAGITMEAIRAKIDLTAQMMRKIVGRTPRIGVCALNPHASDEGLFGDEEARVIRPAVEAARTAGIDVTGPWPADTLFGRAARGEFDGLVAMYHDQGHIAIKLLSGLRAVNITLGLPIVRTSVAHGTAYDIAGTGRADPTSLLEATKVAARLCAASEPLAGALVGL